ncbi:ArnT family glycosyltransferase [Mucilaginibacter sp. X4EP1]|uniref:ArnT family glycosyltransferase n=1 Tax=Mucilaginibacter sp. X4EP1 TaxID=2723092 RepID=UPI0021672E29|nr:glycosyltransferase family 39 protein [Mucilaginibacter sp. X4EP1]MCS3811588.1 hypothetical protein [Mucilaginibacter sp. X4EP1]
MVKRYAISNYKPTLLHVIIILTLLQLFIALFTNGFAFSQEEGMWHYIGRNWFRNGLAPYQGGVDNKSPLFFAIFGLSDKLFGVNYWFPRAFGTLCQSIGIYFIYKIANRLSGHRAGLLAISFYGLSVLWHGVDGRYVSFTETYDVMFVIVSFYFFLNFPEKNKGLFLSGFCGAIGAAFRLSALFGVVTLFIVSLKKSKKSALVFSIGFLSGISLLLLTATLVGINIKDIYIYSFADNFGQGSTTYHNLLWRMVQFYNMFFYSEVILFYPLVIIYIYIKKRIDWLLLWLILAFVGINVIGNYARVDLKDLLPALSLVGALAVSYLIDKYQLSIKKIMIIIWVVFSPKIVEPLLNFTRLFTGEFQKAKNFCHAPFIEPDESASRQLGLWVKANTSPTDKVFVAGFGSQVQAYSERMSPTIYFNVTQTVVAKKRFLLDMEKNKPEMILVPLFDEYKLYVDPDLRLYIDKLVAADYTFDQCMFNYGVYRLKP